MKRVLAFALNLLSAILCLFSCQKAPELTITSASSIELSADGSNGSITFTANRAWSASSSDSWVTVSPSSGEASDKPVTVTVRCNANTTYDDRTATVTIRMEDLSQTIMVRQPANLGIIVPTQAFVLTSEGRTIDVEVQANVQYTVDISVDWIRQPDTKGLTSTQYSFIIAENTTYDDREGKITIKSQNASVPDQVISVKQAQKDAILVKDTSFDMPYGGGEIEIKVESNVAFDVKPTVDWIHYVGTKGLSSTTLKLNVDENTTFSSRQGQVEITQQGGSTKNTVAVNQAGRIAVTSVELDLTSLTLKPEETATLVATVKPDNATDKTVTWTSSDSSIASVDNTGKVTAIKEGTSTITAKAGDKTSECKVTVCIPVTSITLNKTALVLKVGKTATLVATVKPDNATDKAVTWTSSDSGIATVDETGNVTAVKEGTSTITAKARDKEASCAVTVLKPSVYVGNAVDLGIIITKEDGSAYKLLWADTNLGTDMPEEYGDYYAWGETEEKDNYSWETYKFRTSGDYYDNVQFSKYNTKESYGPVDNTTVLDPEDDVAHVKLGGKWRMPTDAEWTALRHGNNCTWTWTTKNEIRGYEVSSKINSNIIFLPAAGCMAGQQLDTLDVSGGFFGYCWSSVLSSNTTYGGAFFFRINQAGISSLMRYCGAPVRPVMETEITVTSIELDKTSLSLKPNETVTLVATIKPDEASNIISVVWSSSDSEIATVDNTGKVTAVKEGTATITAKAGDKTAECEVAVCIPVTSIELDKTELALKTGETAPLTATVKPDNATVTWTSSDTSIASVDNTGKVTAIREGSVTVMAKAGNKYASCSVLVYEVVPEGAVDLGIIMTRASGSKYCLFWAECNIGASKPEEYGGYYAWGETEEKEDYSWETYKWANGTENKLTKYCPTNKTDYWDGTGSPDGKRVLDPEDDVAHVKLGGKWRMPTSAEWEILRNNCTWTWTTQNEVYGIMVTSKKNGNSIFLPAAGYNNPAGGGFTGAGSLGEYYSCNLDLGFFYPCYANSVYFRSGTFVNDAALRCFGLPVRPVTE